MAVLGGLVMVVGGILVLVGGVWLLVEAFMESIWWGLAYVFIPFASLLFLILHWERAGKPFLISLGGGALIVLAMFAMGGLGVSGG